MDLRMLFEQRLRELLNLVIYILDFFYENGNSVIKIMVYERESLLMHFDIRGIRYYIMDDNEHEIANQVVFLVFDFNKDIEKQMNLVTNALIEFYEDIYKERKNLVENPVGY